GPEDPGQPAVRPAELQPGRDRRRARLGVTGPRPGQVDLAGGAVADLLIVLATSPRVAPGLLSWPAWEALRSAAAVLAPVGHRLRVECPWDARQTHQTLARHLLEEPYEALEALESGDDRAFCEELGDVLLQVVFHARVAAERADGYTIDDVADGIVAKLVRRH